jgi:hypothetical protein
MNLNFPINLKELTKDPQIFTEKKKRKLIGMKPISIALFPYNQFNPFFFSPGIAVAVNRFPNWDRTFARIMRSRTDRAPMQICF